MSFETTATRLWKRLSPEERRLAAAAFWREPVPELVPTALGAIVQARRMRPQAARALSQEVQARVLASVLDPGEALASSLLVSLHLAERRPLLCAFLDGLGLPHDNGLLKDEPSPRRLEEGPARVAVEAVARAFDRPQVEVYLNTLWLQDPDRWDVLRRSPDWL